MQTINIKPLSVNEAWQGKRFKSKKYLSYEKEMLLTLKPLKLPPPPYAICFEFGMSNILSDIDNPVKPMIDILQKKYLFNDRDVFELNVIKTKVTKGKDFIKFEIKQLKNN